LSFGGANIAISYCNGSGKAAILGGSYKPNTDVIEASPAIEIAKHVAASAIKISIHDPVAIGNIQKMHGSTFQCGSIAECLEGSDVCIVGTPCEEYKALTENDFRNMKGSIVIDCWRILRPFSNTARVKQVQIGVGNSEGS